MAIGMVGHVMVLVMVLIQILSVDAQGGWQLLQKNAGISCMHAAVTHFDTVIMLDRTNTGPSQIKLAGACRNQPLERMLKNDCWAHSSMLNPGNGAVRPLRVETDTWCSSGQFFDNGVLVQTGGDFEGNKKIRTLAPCGAGGNCDWKELAEPLAWGRWYASNQLLPSRIRQIIVGGRSEGTYEFYPKRKAGEGAFPLAVVAGGADNLYPFVFLLPNGTYRASRTNAVGAPASKRCGRIVAAAGNAGWAMEDMPMGRTMGDMLNLPNGEVLNINGAGNGFQGWGKAGNPVLSPVNYNPNAAAGKRFAVLAKTGIPRMYHSTASILADGRIIVAGSNTHHFYTFTGAFPTELRVEAFSPPYLGANFNAVRPVITGASGVIKYNQVFTMTFNVATRVGGVTVFQNSAPFTTHSYSQGQRSLQLKTTVLVKVGGGCSMQVTACPGNNIAPPAYYIVHCVQNGIPSRGKWVKQNN
ncbi:hypothetical protein M758_1G326600 [Ceratodon purpureus]|nr:hypothetical protein M758_1G326600 [Ceratodon purpureus]